jgi:tetratricopeptide (TPR) repeat protein
MTMHRKFILIAVACLLAILPAFAGKKKPQPPAGVDSTIHRQADSLGQKLFGEADDETKAKREFEKGREDFSAGQAFVAEADSMRRTGQDTTMKKPGGFIGLLRAQFGDTAYSSRELETRKRAESAFEQAEDEFSHVLKISPNMKEARLWLAATYDQLFKWDKSVLLYYDILQDRQGDDRIWFNYGYAALNAKQYEKAVTGLQRAIDISELISGDSSKTPNTYRVYAAEAYTRTYQDQLALAMFRKALAFADPATAKEVQRMIDWIQWDNGGIRTAEYRDQAFKAENANDFKEARRAYESGIGVAKTEKAHDELTWRLALVEYRDGDPEQGLAHMKSLVEGRSNVREEFRESYGKMLFAYAQTLQKKSDTRGALSYFLQSTTFPWSAQGAGFVEIAQVAANDLDTAIEQATKALSYPLTKEQQNSAYSILESSYRSKGNWEKMKQYRQLLESNK